MVKRQDVSDKPLVPLQTEDLLASRIGLLACAQLQRGSLGFSRDNLAQFVYEIEARCIRRDAQLGSNPECINGSTALYDFLNSIFREIAAGEDGHLAQFLGIKDATHRPAGSDEVPTVQPDSAQPMPMTSKFSRHDRGMLNTAYIIVSINQERGTRWKGLGEGAKGLQLGRECLHKGMGHRAKNRDPEELPGEHIAPPCATSQISRARTLEPGLRSLRTTQPKFHDLTSL